MESLKRSAPAGVRMSSNESAHDMLTNVSSNHWLPAVMEGKSKRIQCQRTVIEDERTVCQTSGPKSVAVPALRLRPASRAPHAWPRDAGGCLGANPKGDAVHEPW